MLYNVYSISPEGTKRLEKVFETISDAEEWVENTTAFENSPANLLAVTNTYTIERPQKPEEDHAVQLQNRVVMANTIINDLEYNLTKHYLLLLRYMISKIKPEDKPNKRYSISIKEFFQLCGIDEKNGGNYTRIVKKAYETIQSNVRWVESKGDKYAVQWFADFVIRKNRTIEYEFHRRIAPYLFDLVHYKEGYTGYIFDDATVLETKYGVRLYEWVRECKNMGLKYRTISLDELKSIVGGKNYSLYNDFNRFILKKAVAEINATIDIKLTYEKVIPKGSKSVSAVLFRFGDITDAEEMEARQENRRIFLLGEIKEKRE